MKFPQWAKQLAGQVTPLRSQLLNNPYYRFQSAAEVQMAASLGIAIDPNQATPDDWLRLPGLSIHQARSLVALRQGGVTFHGLEDVAAALGLSLAQVQPWAPVLQFCYYDPASPLHIQPVNLNRASVEQLSRVPAIDLYLARAIVAQRKKGGAYRTLAEFQQRLSLSASLTAELMHYLRCWD